MITSGDRHQFAVSVLCQERPRVPEIVDEYEESLGAARASQRPPRIEQLRQRGQTWNLREVGAADSSPAVPSPLLPMTPHLCYTAHTLRVAEGWDPVR